MSKNVKLAKRILSVILSMALLLGELPTKPTTRPRLL